MRNLGIGTVVFLLSLSAFGQPQNGVTQPAKRYPWDARPDECFIPNNSTAPPIMMCQPVSNWPNFAETKRHIDDLFVTPDFDLIRMAEKEVGFSKSKFPAGQYMFEAWELFLEAHFENMGEYGASQAKLWISAEGDEGFGKLAEAFVKHGEAWQARGTGFASTVSPEAWEIYYQKLDEANSILDDVPSDLKRTGSWHMLKLRIAFELPKLKPSASKLLRMAATEWPDSTLLYEIPMRFSHPNWGGSFEEMDSLAKFAAEQSRKTLGAGMYSLLYEQVFRGRGDGQYSLRDTKVDWPMMKQGFRDIESRGLGETWLWRNFAAVACQMRDRDEARRLYAIYDRVNVGPSTPQIDPCRKFAETGLTL